MLCASLQLNSDLVYVFPLLCIYLVKYGYTFIVIIITWIDFTNFG